MDDNTKSSEYSYARDKSTSITSSLFRSGLDNSRRIDPVPPTYREPSNSDVWRSEHPRSTNDNYQQYTDRYPEASSRITPSDRVIPSETILADTYVENSESNSTDKTVSHALRPSPQQPTEFVSTKSDSPKAATQFSSSDGHSKQSDHRPSQQVRFERPPRLVSQQCRKKEYVNVGSLRQGNDSIRSSKLLLDQNRSIPVSVPWYLRYYSSVPTTNFRLVTPFSEKGVNQKIWSLVYCLDCNRYLYI